MPFHAGFDAAVYPGDACMAWLRAHSNLRWCGYYLSPAPSLAPDALSWRGRRAALAGQWGLAPIYVGQQVRHGASAVSSSLNFDQGCLDGAEAVENAVRDGFAAGSYLYLDWEDGGPLAAEALNYIGAWLATVNGRGFGPGIYCSHLLAGAIEKLLPTLGPAIKARLWCYGVPSSAEHRLQTPLDALPAPDPGGCGYR